MSEVLQFAVLGLGVGGVYALAAQGLMVIYRGSGVLNFAQGAIGMVGAFTAWELRLAGAPLLLAVLGGAIAAAAVGFVAYWAVIRPLGRASALAQLIGTLAILLVLEQGALLRYGATPVRPEPYLPKSIVSVGDVDVSSDRLWLVAIAVLTTAGLWAFYRYSTFGLVTSAVAENEEATAATGRSPSVVAAVNWALGSALAGFAATLVSPIVTMQVANLTNIVIASLATAYIARFRSFPVALVAGLAFGVLGSLVDRFVSITGLGASLPFLAVTAAFIFSGQALPLRGHLQDRLPSVGSGRVRLRVVVPVVAVAAVLVANAPFLWPTRSRSLARSASSFCPSSC
jgi:branched-subunit amino acid ABC-type transport system permease component